MYICSQNLLSVLLSECSVRVRYKEGILLETDPFPANLQRILNIMCDVIKSFDCICCNVLSGFFVRIYFQACLNQNVDK